MRIRIIPTCFIVLTIIICFCQIRVPENINTTLYSWFLNVDSSTTKLMTSLKLSPKTLDTIVLKIKEKDSKTGNSYITLSDNNKRDYILGYSTPKKILTDSLYPLIVYLHGGINVTKNDKGKNAYKMFRFLSDSIDLFLASPSGNKTTPWWDSSGLNRILQSLRFITMRYPIDPDRVFLAGVSDGVLGCYAAANAINAPFAGFIAISGYGGMLPQLGIELYPSNLQQRPIYNINGGKDHLFPLRYINEFLNWLEGQGVPIERKVYPDEKHGFDYREKEKVKLLEIINSWRKPLRTNISWTIVPNMPNLTDNLLSWEIDDNKTDVRVNAFWQEDTLRITTNGIRSFSMITNRLNKQNIFIKKNKSEIDSKQPEKLDTNLYLMMMQHFSYPVLKKMSVYTFHFLVDS